MKHFLTVAAVAAAALCLAGCRDSEPEVDPAAVDAHLNGIIANEAKAREQLVEDARDREDVREEAMEQRAADYRDGDPATPANRAAAR